MKKILIKILILNKKIKTLPKCLFVLINKKLMKLIIKKAQLNSL